MLRRVSGYDIVGYDIVGQQYPNMGGQRVMRYGQPQGQHPPMRPAGLAYGPHGSVLHQTVQHDALRREILPFPLTTVPAGGTATMQALPQRIFRVDALILQPDVASPSGIYITLIRVGAELQTIADGAIPIESFAANAVNSYLRGDTAQPGITITILLTSTNAGVVHVGGQMVGEQIRM